MYPEHYAVRASRAVLRSVYGVISGADIDEYEAIAEDRRRRRPTRHSGGRKQNVKQSADPKHETVINTTRRIGRSSVPSRRTINLSKIVSVRRRPKIARTGECLYDFRFDIEHVGSIVFLQRSFVILSTSRRTRPECYQTTTAGRRS